MNISPKSTINQDHLQLPSTSASIPCNKGRMAPPTTPIINTPEATDVYLPKWATDRVKMAPHIIEWNNPTAVSNHGLFRRIANKASAPAETVVTTNCTRGEILLKELPTNRPTSIPPQYSVAINAGDA